MEYVDKFYNRLALFFGYHDLGCIIFYPGRSLDTNLSVATWVWHNGEPAGMGTDTLPEAWAYYLPMKTTDTVRGVVGFHFDNPEQILTPENKNVLDYIVLLGTMAIERIARKE
jgi:K+-sensing histidine kinase KdpD